MTVAEGAVWLALAVLAGEAGWLALRYQRGAATPPPLQIVSMTGAGFGLLLALLAALTQSSQALILASLALGGVMHAIDLIQRLRR